MTTDSLSQIWQMAQGSAQGPMRKLTTDNYRYRLTPETASAGFIALHTAEVMHRFARIMFGREISIPLQAVGGVSDDGHELDLAEIQQKLDDSFALIAELIRQTADEQWAEIVSSPFGDIPRMQVLVFLMHHNSYHAGQIAQAIKKGQEFPVIA
ncbi:DinB family protein [Spirosoma panaciterrae]|uniref:DinB family protein n=1 Tax=Spirosoma panaciterrae TaxID=496058 RepID=UPI00035DB7DA|nr:DinB family protein [Spirosoma panaciterrae]